MKIMIVAIALVGICTTANAQTFTTQRYGNQTYTNGPNGYNATQQTFGGLTFGHDSEGNSWTSQKFGGQTYTTVVPGFNNGW